VKKQNEETENEHKEKEVAVHNEKEDTGHKEKEPETPSLDVVTHFMKKIGYRKFCELTDHCAEMTCCLGKLRASFEQMTQLFGPPHDFTDKDGKVDCEWQFWDEITLEYVSIYNYRTGSRPDGKLDWSVGGKMYPDGDDFALVRECKRLKEHLPVEIPIWSIHTYVMCRIMFQ